MVDLPAPGQAGEPQGGGPLVLHRGVAFAGDVDGLPVDVAGAAEREVQHAGGDGGVGFAVDQDEAAQRAAGFVGLPDDGLGGGERDDADAVQGQRLGGEVLGGVDVDLVFERLDGGADGSGAGFEPVGAAGQERVGGHPDERCLELVGGFGRVGGGGDDVAAAAVDLVGERERDGLAGHGLGQVAVEGDDAGDGGGLAGGDDADRVARADGAGGDQAGEAAVVGIGAVDPLDGQSEGLGLVGDLVELHAFEMGQQGGARGARACWPTGW